MSAELFEAIDQHDGDRVLSLLRAGASPNDSSPDVPYWKPLEAAIEEMESGGSIDVVKALIEGGADVNAPGDHPKIISRLRPIHCAVFHGNLAAAKLLLENGADPNVPTDDGNTALKWAAENLDIPMIAALLDAGADPEILDAYNRAPRAYLPERDEQNSARWKDAVALLHRHRK
jgi:ankyrin repeat protein